MAKKRKTKTERMCEPLVGKHVVFTEPGNVLKGLLVSGKAYSHSSRKGYFLYNNKEWGPANPIITRKGLPLFDETSYRFCVYLTTVNSRFPKNWTLKELI